MLKKATLQISDAPGLSPETSQSLSSLRNRVQHALFQMIRERLPSEQPTSAAASRFGNILLLLPPLAVRSHTSLYLVAFRKGIIDDEGSTEKAAAFLNYNLVFSYTYGHNM